MLHPTLKTVKAPRSTSFLYKKKDSTCIKQSLSIAMTFLSLTMFVSSVVLPAAAEISGLTPCAQSKAFSKRKKQELKDIEKRMKKYSAESSPSIALKATLDKTNKRFDTYAKSGLLCGSDGLPHLVSEPGLALKYGHAGDIFIPTFGFVYVAAWIGHSGRLYLKATRNKDKEIIIDVPLALACIAKALAWPILVIGELRTGTLLENDSNITISP